jgi:predicted lipoprotein
VISRRVALIVVAAATLASCSSDVADRVDVAAMLVVGVGAPGFADLAATTEALRSEVDQWCAGDTPTADVSDLITQARMQWLGLSPFWFGPAMERRSRFVIDPRVSADEVESLVGMSEPVDTMSLRNQYGTDQRGLGAIDVLLGAAPTVTVCNDVRANAALVAGEAAALATEWQSTAAERSADDSAANDTLGSIVNEVLFAIMAAEQRPVNAAQAQLVGIRNVFLPAPIDDSTADDSTADDSTADDSTTESAGLRLGSLLDDAVVQQLRVDFDAAIANPDTDTLDAVERTVLTNVVSALGLSVQFSDADGDG